jgi:hypothetical protein
MYLGEIVDVVSDFVNSGSMFTAWDVTVAVRKRSKDRVQHFEVKKEVHRMFDQGDMTGYNRVLANLPGVNPQPWLYYPPSADPTTYTGKPTAPAIAVALPAPTSSMSQLDDGADIGGDGSVIYKFDTTDRLCVPNKLIREMGLKTGDEVEVVSAAPHVNEVSVFQKGTPAISANGFSQVATYTVDSYDNVRITRSALNKIGLNGVAFEIERNGNEIKVKKYA